MTIRDRTLSFRTRVEIDSDNVDLVYNLFLNASSAVNKFSDVEEFLTALKNRVLSAKEVTKAAKDFTLPEATKRLGRNTIDPLKKSYQWHIEEDVGEKERLVSVKLLCHLVEPYKT